MVKLGRPNREDIARRLLERGRDSIEGYPNWAAVAGYFDGDGNVEEVVGRFVVIIKIGFKDNWDKQLLAVRAFLNRNGVTAGELTKDTWGGSISAWQLRVTNLTGILEMSRIHATVRLQEKNGIERGPGLFGGQDYR